MTRRRHLRGLTAAVALAVAMLAAHVTTVSACSCVGASLADSVRFADIAFIGTVVDSELAGRDALTGGPLVRYAFEIERASEETGPIVEVAAHEDPGGASCGVSFAAGERWFVTAAREEGILRTSLCSGNRVAGGFAAHELAALVELLPVEALPAQPEAVDQPPIEQASGDADFRIPAPLLMAVAGAGIVVAAAAWAFRRDRPR
jgi:hypothetical protein